MVRRYRRPFSVIKQLEINRLGAGTLFRIYFVGLVMTFYPFAIIAGTAAAFGADTLKSGSVQVHGWKAILDTLVGTPVFAFFSAAFLLVFTWPGLWLPSKFKKMTIIFYPITLKTAQQVTGTSKDHPSKV